MTARIRIWFWRNRLHFLLWAVYITYETLLVGVTFGIRAAAATWVLHYLVIFMVFYFNALIGLPLALKNRMAAVWRVPLVILMELGMYLAISFAVDMFLVGIHAMILDGPLRFTRDYMLKNSYRCIYFLGISSGYCFLRRYNHERKKTIELERQRLGEIILRQKVEQELTRAQNAFLKAQINPHFLFNTLDFVYHNVVNLSPVAGDAIIMLTDMMRFAIDADKIGDMIMLGDELEQVENLRSLHYLRKNEEAPFHIIYGDEVTGLGFIPLVLLTLTENIFKHANLGLGRQASLSVTIIDGALTIETENFCGRAGTANSGGRGLLNIGERLKFAYGTDATFRYGRNANGRFMVSLAVPVSLLQKSVPTLLV